MTEMNPAAGVGNQSDLIYRAPEAETAVAPQSDDLFAAYVGEKKADYYARCFMRLQSEGSMISWIWPAFFITGWWLLYRKMWLNAVLYWFVLLIVLSILSGVAGAVTGNVLLGTGLYYGAYVIIGFIVVPMFANWIYYRHVGSKVAKVSMRYSSDEQRAAELSRTGGTSRVVAILIPTLIILIGIIAAITIPAYNDYTARAQVSEGLYLTGIVKAAATDRFEDTGTLAGTNATIGVAPPESIVGEYVASVAYLDGTITVTYGNDAHAVIHGRTVEMTLVPEPSPHWTCSSQSIAAKNLPAACR